jgi:hypothetical protein
MIKFIKPLRLGFVILACLIGSSYAFAGGSLSYLNYTTVNSFNGAISTGGSSFFYSLANPTSYIWESGQSPAGPGTGLAFAYSNGPSTDGDFIGMSLYTNPFSYPIVNGVGSMSLTFSADVYFTDYGEFNTGQSSGWFYNGTAVNYGDLFVASSSPYNFTFNYSYNGYPTNSFLVGARFSLQNPKITVIPLPGAVGLAAIGLSFMSNLRRR